MDVEADAADHEAPQQQPSHCQQAADKHRVPRIADKHRVPRIKEQPARAEEQG
jgi:hypothetical protein